MQSAASSSATPSGVRGVCPKGWHIPSRNEFADLVNFLGGMTLAGGSLKDTILWDPDPNGGATNKSGFSALPGGGSYNNTTFSALGLYGTFWTTTEISTKGALYLRLSALSSSVTALPDVKDNVSLDKVSGVSCRCLKDK